MPVIITQNFHVSLGISNGKEGKASSLVVDHTSKVYKIETQGQCDFYIVDQPPASLLIQVSDPKHKPLEGLPRDVFPIIYPSMSRVTLPSKGKAMWHGDFRRIQVSCTPGFAITDYRAQGRTYRFHKQRAKSIRT